MADETPGLEYADALTGNQAGWLQGKWAQRFLFPFGVMLSGMLEAAKQAVFQRYAKTCDATALHEVGKSRDLPRGHSSVLTEAAYRALLKKPFSTHGERGLRDGILNALVRAGYPASYIYEQRSQYDAIQSPEAVDVLGHKMIGWGRMTQESDWNQFWIVFDIPTLADWTDAEVWTDGDAWPFVVPTGTLFPFIDHATESLWVDSEAWEDGAPWWDPIPEGEVRRVFDIVHKFKGSEQRFMGAYWIFPGGGVTGHPEPLPIAIWNDNQTWTDSEVWNDGSGGNGVPVGAPVVFMQAA